MKKTKHIFRSAALLLAVLASFPATVSAASPGGVGAAPDDRNQIWMRADENVFTAGNFQWNSFSHAASTNTGQGSAALKPTYNITGSSLFNFNPTITFDGVDDVLDSSFQSGNVGGPTDENEMFIVGTANNQGSVLWFGVNPTAIENQNLVFGLSNGTNSAILGEAHSTSQPIVAPAGSSSLLTPTIQGYRIQDKTADLTDHRNYVNGRDNGLFSTILSGGANVDAPSIVGFPPVTIGAKYSTSGDKNAFIDGTIAEIVFFNSALTATERQQVNAYLGLKYGITVDQTTATDYIASNGTTEMWDKDLAGASTYNNDIAGLGRDDESGLNQKQSKSVNGDALVTMGLDTIEVNNDSNPQTFAADYSFMTWGNDNGAIAWQSGESPAARRRLTREWMVQEENTVGAVEVRVPDDSSSFAAKLPTEHLSTVELLIDADGDFSSGATAIPMTLGVDGQWVTTSDVNFTDGQFFTFATAETVEPTVTIEQAGTQSDPTHMNSIEFTVTFSEEVEATTLDVSDFIVGTSPASPGAIITSLTQNSATVWTVIVQHMDNHTTVTLDLPIGAFTDLAGNANTAASTSVDNSVLFDIPSPNVDYQITNDQTPTLNGECAAGNNLTITVNGNTEPVTCDGSGAWTINWPHTIPEGVYDVEVDDLTAPGVNNHTAPNTISSTNALTVDITAPSVTVNQEASQADPTNDSPILFTVITSSDINPTSVASGDFSISGSATASVSSLVQSGVNEWTVEVTGMVSNETVVLTVPSGAFLDIAGNVSAGSTSTDNAVTYDTTPPVATIDVPALTNDNTPIITATCESGIPYLLSVITTGEFVTGTCGVSGTISFVPTTPIPDGNYSAGIYQTDLAGNISAIVTDSGVIDTTPPPAPVISSPSVNGTTPGLVTGTGEVGATVTVSGPEGGSCTTTVQPDASWSCTLSPVVIGDHGTVTAFQTDPVGNVGPSATVNPVTITPDDVEADTIMNQSDYDMDNDGTLNGADADSDGDGELNTVDPDDDNDGTPDGSDSTPLGLVGTIVYVTTNGGDATVPTQGSTIDTSLPLFKGTTEAGRTVTVKNAAGTELCTTVADGSGNWSCLSTVALGYGSHAATASSFNGSQLTATAVLNFSRLSPTPSYEVTQKLISPTRNQSVPRNGKMTYRITVKNTGTTALDELRLRHVFPGTYLTFSKASTEADVVNANGTVTWNNFLEGSVLEPGESRTTTVTYAVSKISKDKRKRRITAVAKGDRGNDVNNIAAANDSDTNTKARVRTSIHDIRYQVYMRTQINTVKAMFTKNVLISGVKNSDFQHQLNFEDREDFDMNDFIMQYRLKDGDGSFNYKSKKSNAGMDHTVYLRVHIGGYSKDIVLYNSTKEDQKKPQAKVKSLIQYLEAY